MSDRDLLSRLSERVDSCAADGVHAVCFTVPEAQRLVALAEQAEALREAITTWSETVYGEDWRERLTSDPDVDQEDRPLLAALREAQESEDAA